MNLSCLNGNIVFRIGSHQNIVFFQKHRVLGSDWADSGYQRGFGQTSARQVVLKLSAAGEGAQCSIVKRIIQVSTCLQSIHPKSVSSHYVSTWHRYGFLQCFVLQSPIKATMYQNMFCDALCCKGQRLCSKKQYFFVKSKRKS